MLEYPPLCSSRFAISMILIIVRDDVRSNDSAKMIFFPRRGESWGRHPTLNFKMKGHAQQGGLMLTRCSRFQLHKPAMRGETTAMGPGHCVHVHSRHDGGSEMADYNNSGESLVDRQQRKLIVAPPSFALHVYPLTLHWACLPFTPFCIPTAR
jgi:hypothetical protein